jgi:hypothetical protein
MTARGLLKLSLLVPLLSANLCKCPHTTISLLGFFVLFPRYKSATKADGLATLIALGQSFKEMVSEWAYFRL